RYLPSLYPSPNHRSRARSFKIDQHFFSDPSNLPRKAPSKNLKKCAPNRNSPLVFPSESTARNRARAFCIFRPSTPRFPREKTHPPTTKKRSWARVHFGLCRHLDLLRDLTHLPVLKSRPQMNRPTLQKPRKSPSQINKSEPINADLFRVQPPIF